MVMFEFGVYVVFLIVFGWLFWNKNIVSFVGNCCYKGEIVVVVVYYFNDEGLLVVGCGGGEVVDGIDNMVQSSIGIDGYIGFDEVIVDGFDEFGDYEGGVFLGYFGVYLVGVDEFSDQVCLFGVQYIQVGE